MKRPGHSSLSTVTLDARLQRSEPWNSVTLPPLGPPLTWRMKDVQKCKEAGLPAAVGFSAVGHTRSLESKIRRVGKEIKANGFKGSAGYDPWERTNQT